MEEPAEVVVEVTLKPNDLYTPFQWSRGNLVRWVASALLCYIFYDLYSSNAETIRSFEDGTSILALVAILIVFVLLAMLLFPYLRVRSMFRGKSRFSLPRRYIFRSDAIHVEDQYSTAETKWSVYQTAYETTGVFILAQDKFRATYIPKRCLKTSTDKLNLRRMIRENVNGKRTLRTD